MVYLFVYLHFYRSLFLPAPAFKLDAGFFKVAFYLVVAKACETSHRIPSKRSIFFIYLHFYRFAFSISNLAIALISIFYYAD